MTGAKMMGACLSGADFSMVIGLSEQGRSAILGFSSQDLTTWNAYTRCNTKDSLDIRHEAYY